MVATNDASGLPPVDLYRIGDAYFVADGHHRVSVARENEASSIQAYVTEIRSDVPLEPDIREEELILKAEYADFLSRTLINKLRPEAKVTVSEAGQYGKMLEHIDVHKYFMGIDYSREISDDEAVGHWYDSVYLPVVLIIRELELLRDFPHRTEADLYLWISKHRSEIGAAIGWDVDYSAAAIDLVEQQSTGFRRLISRLGRKVIDVVSADDLPQKKTSKSMVIRDRSVDQGLFADILVPISGEESGWIAVDQAVAIASREGGRILGLHITGDAAYRDSPQADEIRNEFSRRCDEAGIPNTFSVAQGPVAQTICDRAQWCDLVIIRLLYPPGPSAISRYSSGLAKMIRGCSRPILAIPDDVSELRKPMLVVDNNPRDKAAKLIAAYISSQWQLPVGVLIGDEGGDLSDDELENILGDLEDYGFAAGMTGVTDRSAEAILL
jgi:nucleotide-binding universal stress UspA family protein